MTRSCSAVGVRAWINAASRLHTQGYKGTLVVPIYQNGPGGHRKGPGR
ncbi:hypothetical protein HMPREF0290_1146, partial [Corynebacterium efficiens YS-314]